MDSLVRKVLARYFESPGEYPPDMNMSWMEYLRDKSKTYIDPDNPVKGMLKGKEFLNPSFNTTNPYDYESPSDKPKDQKDSPPFENIIDYPSMFGVFNRPNLFGDQGALKEWYQDRRQDWTTDPDEQQPAISLDRKRLASAGIPEEALLSFAVPGSDFFEFAMRSKIAASFNEIVNKDFHYKNDLKLQRSSDCTVTWSNEGNTNQTQKGLFTFRVTSPGSEYRYHNVFIQFLRDDELNVTEYVDYPVHIGCTCPSFLYSGAQYYAVQGGYMYMPAFKPDLVPPHLQTQYTVSVSEHYPEGRRNPGRGLNSRVCKHILAVFKKMEGMEIVAHYKKYPIYSPPNANIDKKAWQQMMKFPFTEEEIKKRLLSSDPKVPAYFNREAMLPAVIDWFKYTWFPRTDAEKLKSLQEFKMFPERVFFILIEEAYLKRQNNEYISKRLVDEGYNMMAQIIQPENEAEGQTVYEENKDQVGTGPVKVTDEEVTEEKNKSKRNVKQYGTGEGPGKKVKQPGRLKRPSTVQPAIK